MTEKQKKSLRLLLPAAAVALLSLFLVILAFLPEKKPSPAPSDEQISCLPSGQSGEQTGRHFLPLKEGDPFRAPLLDLTPAEPSGAAEPSPEPSPEEPSDPSPDGESLTLSFVGDCMLATLLGGGGPDTLNYEMDRQDPAFFFQYTSPYFQEDDFTFANCENVFTDRDLPPVDKNYRPAYWYRSASKNAAIFRAAGIDGVSVCNNHTGDYGEQGYADTLAALSAAGVAYGESAAPLIFEKHRLKLGIICANLYGSGQTEKILRQVRELKESCGYIIVYFHGGTERVHKPEEWKVEACRRIAEEGADLLLGCHPHVLQKSEILHRKDGSTALAVYSLGNFLFGGGRTEENRTAIVRLRLTLEEGAVLSHQLELIPCYVYATKDHSSPECWIPKPMEEGEARDRVLAFLRGEAESPT